MGAVYFLIALGTNCVLGLPLAALTSVVGRAAHGDPVLRAVRRPGRRRSIVALLFEPERAAADAHPDGRRLDRRDERPAAADHAGRRRDPPDRRPRLGAHRVADRGHPGRDLRDPDRGGRVGVLLPVPAPDVGRPVGRRPGARTASSEREGRPGPGPARADARAARRTSTTSDRRDRPATAADGAAATPRERRTTPDRRDDAAGHDPRAGPDRAPRPRQGTRRAARRRRGAGRAAGPAGQRPAARRMDEPAADPGDQRRRGRVARPARAQAGARPDGRGHGRRARHEPERGRPPEDPDAPAARPRADARRRLARLLGRRLADRRGQPRLPRLLRARLRPRRVRASTTARTSATTSPTRARSAPRWRRSSTTARRFAISQEYYEHPDFALAGRGRHDRRPQHPRARPVAGRADQRQRPGRRRSRSSTAFEVTRLGKRVYQDQLIERLDPRGHPLLLDRRAAAVGAGRRGDRLPRGRQPADRGDADPPRPDRAAAAQAAADVVVAASRRPDRATGVGVPCRSRTRRTGGRNDHGRPDEADLEPQRGRRRRHGPDGGPRRPRSRRCSRRAASTPSLGKLKDGGLGATGRLVGRDRRQPAGRPGRARPGARPGHRPAAVVRLRASTSGSCCRCWRRSCRRSWTCSPRTGRCPPAGWVRPRAAWTSAACSGASSAAPAARAAARISAGCSGGLLGGDKR